MQVGPLGDVPLWEQLDPAGSDPVRAEALARSLLLAQFVSAGQVGRRGGWGQPGLGAEGGDKGSTPRWLEAPPPHSVACFRFDRYRMQRR